MSRSPLISAAAVLIVPALPATAQTAAAPAVAPSANAELARLLSSARMWEAKNRADLARNALDKILTIEPQQPDALLLLAQIELRSNRPAEAQRILQRLRQHHPKHPATRELEDTYRIATQDKREMATVRMLARGGNEKEALERLHKLFPDGPPQGELGIDYYRILAGTDAGRPRAIAELRRQLAQRPDDARLALVLGDLLTDRPATRAEGLGLLYRLSQRTDADRKTALDIWRRTLYRVSDDPAYAVWFERYLQEAPDDDIARQTLAELEARREAHRRMLADPAYQARQRGLRQLERGNLAEAQAAFEQAMRTRGNDAEVVGGLGLVRLREGRHDEARALFSRALQLDPEQRNKWRSLLDTATFWGTIARARLAGTQGKPGEAETLARQALARQPDNADALVILADALVAQQREAEAETLLRQQLAGRMPDPGALRRLVTLLQNNGRGAEIDPLLAATEARLQTSPANAQTLRQLRAELLTRQADQLLAERRASPAIARLEEALRLTPDAPWTRYTLARAYRDLGLPALGRETMDEGLRLAPNADMRHASALYLNSVDDPDAAAALLAQIPEAERTEGMRELGGNLHAQQLLRQGRLALAAGRPDEARALLRQAAQATQADPQMLATVGREAIALGESDYGLGLVQQWLAAHPDAPAIGVRLRYGELLAAAGRDEALRAWLEDLRDRDMQSRGQRGAFEPAQRAALGDQALRLALRDTDRRLDDDDAAGALRVLAAVPAEQQQDPRWSLALADVRERQGDLDGAAAAARTVLARNPDDADARLTLARLAERGGRNDEALRIVREVLAGTAEDDIDTRLSAARRLTALRRESEAAAVVEPLRQRYPQRADIVVQQGRIAQSGGRFDDAASLYRRARTLEQADATAPMAGGTAAQRALQDLDARRDGQVATATLFSRKSGDSGISELSATEIPLYVRIPHGYTGHAFFHADTVLLDAGTLRMDASGAEEFGQIAARGSTGIAPRGQSDKGVALAAGYAYNGAYDSWRADLGTTPLGFLQQSVVGGLRYRAELNRAAATIDVSRRAVTSSLISYAGAIDPASGERWGGVVRNGVTLGYSHDVGRGSVFATVGSGVLTGHNVRTNREFTVRAGFDWPLLQARHQRVTSGLVVNYWRYQENLRYYTFGHGGYYSPQRYLSLSVPLEWSGRRGAWSWRLGGSAGWSDTYEKDMPFYPTRPDLQALSGNRTFGGGNGGGFSYTALAAVEYRFAPKWVAGMALQIDRSRDYAPNRAIAYLRYHFEPQRGPVPFPPEPVRPYSSY
ncbi:Tetratricopeptide repeats [Cupriavidus gilardii CR3]|uniref:Tetratricopeptide repeat protein n=1 Tax=Cupriavidus gilardii TaxID=82541 RepID=A0A849BE96_9BURK|nr:cellulose synthase subunit BcsC-related outer membrane protein [Cupriavidus gilardii]ALD91017.1 Tetratricopeptide repeats [Cupriavidus gilardii CR3]KAB0596294.1 tetratricopeptide repeat protein [Cupriavidus gilardii]MCT9012188.1 cellulose synthase subunit BcsC-related outer membrane protein [Cupriavidus gilardii]MCT9053675.1 cellulose synthase subunit BcsC-related outer membrane protein [Cupriavidus gilardii]NNH14271.1 tetratricopeptide repeat protein [Cupriavidus gilardii]